MPRKRTSPQLEQIFLKSKAFADAGKIIDSDFLRQIFGVTQFGASCLLYMLSERQFYPCLEKIYTRDEAAELIGKTESKNHFIEFTEKFSPFNEGEIFGSDMSEKQKALYVSMGIARNMSFEEFRQLEIGIYVKMDMVLEASRTRFLAALHGKDAAYIKNILREQNH